MWISMNMRMAVTLIKSGSKRSGLVIWMIAVASALVLTGCTKSNRWDGFNFKRAKTSKDYLDMALESERADDRRKGVNGLAESSDATSDWAVKVFDTIARTDTDAMVRRAALRALLRSANSDRVPTTLKLLKSSDVEYEDVRPATAPVRWTAARLLLAVVHGFAFHEDQKSEIVETILDRLPKESDQNVRLALIETLGYFQQRPVLEALINELENEDFAVQHAAELALVSLTGVTHHHYPSAWRKWLAETSDPFAQAGETPEELQATRSKPRWDWLYWWE